MKKLLLWDIYKIFTKQIKICEPYKAFDHFFRLFIFTLELQELHRK